MKYAIDQLDKLADRLEAAAVVAEAKEKEHRQHILEMDEADAQASRAKSGRHFAAVCRYFAERERMISRKEKTQPTFEEVLEYVASNPKISDWPKEAVQCWYDHFESNGWKVSGKTPMKSWKAAARNGYKFYRDKHPKKRVSVVLDDPPQWRAFLTSIKREYQPYRFAPDHVKSDFNRRQFKP